MTVRLAFFEGSVKTGHKEQFVSFVRDNLLPLWSAFPNLQRVTVTHGESADVEGVSFALVVAFEYPSMEAMEEALASPVRQRSREVTQGIFAHFDGRIFHVVGETIGPLAGR